MWTYKENKKAAQHSCYLKKKEQKEKLFYFILSALYFVSTGQQVKIQRTNQMKYTLNFFVFELHSCPGNTLKIQNLDFTLRSFAGLYTNVPPLPNTLIGPTFNKSFQSRKNRKLLGRARCETDLPVLIKTFLKFIFYKKDDYKLEPGWTGHGWA